MKEENLIPYMQMIGVFDTESKGRIEESKTVKRYIDTVYNIHMPGKGEKDIKSYKKALELARMNNGTE